MPHGAEGTPGMFGWMDGIEANKLDRTEAGSTYVALRSASPAPGLLWGFLGDSITNGSAASNFVYSFGPQSMVMVGGLVARPDSFTRGTPGIASAALLADVPTFLGFGPQATVLLVGTNDAGSAASLATYASNMTAIITAVKAVGPVILCTVPPRAAAASAAIHRAVVAQNAWIRMFGPSLGCEIADAYTALVDTTTGYLAAASDSGDGIHPNSLGHQLLAVEVAKAMRRVTGRASLNLVTSVLPSGNLIVDPLNARALPGDGGWLEWGVWTAPTPPFSFVADTSGVLAAGRWLQFDFDATSAGSNRQWATPGFATGWAVGDVLALVAQVQIEDVSGTWVADVAAGTAQMVPLVVDQTGVTVTGSNTFSRCAGIKNAAGFYDIGPTFYPFTIPAGVTNLNVLYGLLLPTGKHAKMRVGALGLLNLTTLGLAGLLGWGNLPVAH